MARGVPPGWRIIEQAGNEIDARLIAGHLEEAGIKVVLEKDQSGYGDYLYGGGNPNAPVTILVPEDRWELATSVLDAAAVTPGEMGREDGGEDEQASGTTGDAFYERGEGAGEAPLAAPRRPALRWVLIALIILIVVLAAVERGFLSGLIGV